MIAMRPPMYSLLRVAAGTAVALSFGCAPSSIEDCSYGRYYADCGDETDSSVVACSATTGECRWFTGDVPDGHVVSDCSPENLCCHMGSGAGTTWAFSGWAPDGVVLETARRDLDLLRNHRISRTEPAGVPVRFAEVPDPGFGSIECDTTSVGFPCAVDRTVGLERLGTRLVGEAYEVVLHAIAAPNRLVIEVIPNGDGSSHARVYSLFDDVDEGGPVQRTCAGLMSLIDGDGELVLEREPGSAVLHGVLDVDVRVDGSRAGHLTVRF